jgi:hypothetical protein
VRKLLRRTTGAAIAIALIWAPNAHADGPQCGDVVTQDVVLQADLLECPGDGLVIAGDDITVDLNYHRIDGTGTEAAAGVRIMAREVTLRHGLITDFDRGVQVHGDGLEDVWLADLNISAGNRGIVMGGGGLGSPVGGGTVTILSSNIHHNSGTGISAGGFWGHKTHIGDTTLEANGGSGAVFRDSSGGTFYRSRIVGNHAAGIAFDFAGGGRVETSLITRNGTYGVGANRSSGLVLLGNTVTFNGRAGEFSGGAFVNEGSARIEHNTFNQNLGFGLALYEFLETRSQWPINHNTANRNLEIGITAAQLGFTGIGNVAKQNGDPAQCVNFPCNSKK